MAVAGGGTVFINGCLSAYSHDISKTDAASSPNFAHKHSTMSRGDPLLLYRGQRSKVKVTSHKTLPA